MEAQGNSFLDYLEKEWPDTATQTFTLDDRMKFHKWTKEGATACLFENHKIFPCFPTDTIEDVLNRYATFPDYKAECAGFMKELQDRMKAQDVASGMSAAGNLRFVGSIPATIYHACINIDPDFWRGDNYAKNMKKMALLAPKLLHGGI